MRSGLPDQRLVPDVRVMESSRVIGNIRTGHFERILGCGLPPRCLGHRRGNLTAHDSASFGNKMMWWPLVVVPALAPAGIAAVFSRRAAKTVLPVASAIVVANGLQGTYLHAPGNHAQAWRLEELPYNVEMGPPAFAPLLASLVGGMGLLARCSGGRGDCDAFSPADPSCRHAGGAWALSWI